MQTFADSYVALENKEEIEMFLVNGKPIIDNGVYPRYFRLKYYWFYDRNFPMWEEISKAEYVLGTVETRSGVIAV